VGAFDRPLAREVASSLPAERITWTHGDWPPREMATLSASLITAEVLLADSGTCVVACPTAPERLLCYLPPACVVVARIDQLAEHLPAAWGELAKRLADPAARGELVMVTGPSRTADIEKILILGAHGPKRLVVLLVG
jgi:L-lactate dehydrogenase complex protein LldG